MYFVSLRYLGCTFCEYNVKYGHYNFQWPILEKHTNEVKNITIVNRWVFIHWCGHILPTTCVESLVSVLHQSVSFSGYHMFSSWYFTDIHIRGLHTRHMLRRRLDINRGAIVLGNIPIMCDYGAMSTRCVRINMIKLGDKLWVLHGYGILMFRPDAWRALFACFFSAVILA